jgi:hypothetical protein
MRKWIDKSGLVFVALLAGLVVIVLSLAMFETRDPELQPKDGELIPPVRNTPAQ